MNSCLFGQEFFSWKEEGCLRQPLMDANKMKRTLARLTYEIIEQRNSLEGVVLIGIQTRGIYLAQRLAANIKKFEDFDVPVGELDISLYRDDMQEKHQDAQLNGTDVPFSVVNKTVILVDDVLYTGRTMRAALDAIMDLGRPQKIEACVLVDRGHRELPIRADYVGKNIPTSPREKVVVELAEIDKREQIRLVPLAES